MADASVHAGHRARMKERFLAANGKDLADHELLEMLLYYVIPRRDTNEIAHHLIEEFGSIERVLDAPIDELVTTQGVSAATATYLALVREAAGRYTAAKVTEREGASPIFDTPEKIVAFLRPKYVGVTVERAYLLLFDNGMRMLDCRHLGDGEISSLLISVRRIAEIAYRKRASRVVLAHNHPDGIALPSKEDLALTRQVAAALQLLEIPLLEHFIFSKYGYCTVLNQAEEQETGTAQKAAVTIPYPFDKQ